MSGPPPDAPANLAASAISNRRITLSWTDQSSNEDGFAVQRCAGTAATCDASGAFVPVGQTAAASTTYSDTQLQATTTYSYRVRAFNGGGESAFTNIAEATTLAAPVVSAAGHGTPTATEAGPSSGVFTISRDSQVTAPLPVSFTLAGTATKGTDYQTPPLSVTIPAGATSVTVAIAPVNDTAIEQPETVILTLAAGADYAIGPPNSATVSIVSDDLSLDLVVTSLIVPSVVAVGGTLECLRHHEEPGHRHGAGDVDQLLPLDQLHPRRGRYAARIASGLSARSGRQRTVQHAARAAAVDCGRHLRPVCQGRRGFAGH